MKKEKWNIVRAIFTNLTLVLLAFLVGYTNDMDILTLPIINMLNQSIDYTLDVENMLKYNVLQQINGIRKLRTAFGAIGFVTL